MDTPSEKYYSAGIQHLSPVRMSTGILNREVQSDTDFCACRRFESRPWTRSKQEKIDSRSSTWQIYTSVYFRQDSAHVLVATS
jgi:hypothetical protein